MTDKVKQLAPQIWTEIQKANKILLHLHPGADPDSAGSALAMMHLLKSLGKSPTVIAGDSKLSPAMSAIPGFDQIVAKNYFEIDPKDFDLFLVLDSSNLGQVSKKGEIIFPENLKIIKIDHHPEKPNSDYGTINLVDTSYCAVCHIIYDLFVLWHVDITKEIALCLFSGIYHDTGGFKYPPTNWETLQAGSELAKIAPDYFRTIFSFENSRTPKQLEFLGLALNSIEHYFSNRLAVAAVSYDQLQKHGISPEDSRNMELPNTLKSVIGWNIAISFVERSPGLVELGFRKREFDEKIDLSLAATALGGGGHPVSSGATIKLPFEEAKKLLIETMAKTYPELGKP